ncbi:putative Magnetosome protein MamP [Magnetofaba australis IT-1]|uniref:MamP n=2 Tax=Magnetofaba TaxID=1472292 RepID=W0LJ06_9PROT|nr:MamP [Magnetofaba australis IT-1]OSM08630.1 putative Magnetosome protein MamP [Magnetofaba australis IT-1]
MPSGTTIVAVGFLLLAILVASSIFDLPGSDLTVTPAPTESAITAPIANQGAEPVMGLSVAFTPGAEQPARQRAPMPTDPTRSGAFVAPDIQLSEAHWQGLEALPLTLELKRKLKLPLDLSGLLVDEVSLNAALSGLQAGDVIVGVNGRAVDNLKAFQEESRRLQMREQINLTAYRKGRLYTFTLSADKNVGLAQVETAPMIQAGDIMPHPYRGPCTSCHAISPNKGTMPDPDLIILPPGPIRQGAQRPHRDRGPCAACHAIVP